MVGQSTVTLPAAPKRSESSDLGYGGNAIQVVPIRVR
jgi:hypothetical protein